MDEVSLYFPRRFPLVIAALILLLASIATAEKVSSYPRHPDLFLEVDHEVQGRIALSSKQAEGLPPFRPARFDPDANQTALGPALNESRFYWESMCSGLRTDPTWSVCPRVVQHCSREVDNYCNLIRGLPLYGVKQPTTLDCEDNSDRPLNLGQVCFATVTDDARLEEMFDKEFRNYLVNTVAYQPSCLTLFSVRHSAINGGGERRLGQHTQMLHCVRPRLTSPWSTDRALLPDEYSIHSPTEVNQYFRILNRAQDAIRVLCDSSLIQDNEFALSQCNKVLFNEDPLGIFLFNKEEEQLKRDFEYFIMKYPGQLYYDENGRLEKNPDYNEELAKEDPDYYPRKLSKVKDGLTDPEVDDDMQRRRRAVGDESDYDHEAEEDLDDPDRQGPQDDEDEDEDENENLPNPDRTPREHSTPCIIAETEEAKARATGPICNTKRMQEYFTGVQKNPNLLFN